MIKYLICLISLFLITACSANLDFSEKSLKQYVEVTQSYMSLDTPIYKSADITKKNNVSDAIYKSAIMKLSVLEAYEKEIKSGFSIEDNIRPIALNDYCWLGKFMSDYRKFYPSDNPLYIDTIKWLDVKRVKWKKSIEENFGDSKDFDSYCPY